MPTIKAGEFERMRNGGRISSVRVQPAGTAVSGYQVNLGNRPSLRDIGVVGAYAWTAEQAETWVRTSVSATCPRRLTVFEGGKKDINKTFEFGDDFDGATLNTAKWTVTGSPTISGGKLIASSSGDVGAWAIPQTFVGHIVGAKFRTISSAGHATVVVGNYCGIMRYADGSLYFADVTGGTKQVIESVALNTWIRYETRFAANVISARKILETTTWSTWNRTPGYSDPRIGAYASNSNAEYEFFTVRKYVAAEPVAGTAQPSALNRSMCQSLNLADGLRACCA